MAKTDGKALNEEQTEAVKHGKGPLLIIAGAGTGKTTVITERIKFLIQEELAKPSEILALTFTEKAAREMQERVDVALPYGYTNLWISTFHSFCDRILRLEILNIGLDPKYKLLTEAETVQFIRSHLFDINLKYFRPLGNPTKFIGGMMQHFSRLQDENILPHEYVEWVKKQKEGNTKQSEDTNIEIEKWEELAGAYKKYDQLKVKESLFDFGDLIVKTLNLFKMRPNVLANYQKQFKFILIDEFQDTNYAQNDLIRTLAGTEKNITVVADDDQSIYRFRGAAVSNVIQFRKYYPDTKIIVLTKNYRSNQEILDRSYQLIQNNNPDRLEVVEHIDKKLISKAAKPLHKKKEEDIIKFIHVDRVENEAETVVREIQSLVLGNSSIKYGDIAILVRANNHSDPFIRAFQRLGVPYQFLGPGRLFKQQEVIDLISYLKVLYNIDDSASFYRLIQNDIFEIDPKDIIRLTNFAKRYNMSLYDAAEKINDPETVSGTGGQGVYISDDGKEKLTTIVAMIVRHLKLIKKETAGQILYYFLQDTGLLQHLINPDTPDVQKQAVNISKFFDKLKTYEVDHEDSTIPAVVDWIELSAELGESPLAADSDWTMVNAVNILTVHSAKGLEFPVVFLVNLVSQRFPTVERREQIPIPEAIIKELLPTGDYHEQEERRLFYVGMTRAKDRLYLTAANYYGEGKREKKLSPFVFEALGDEVLSSEQEAVKSEQLSFLDYRPGVQIAEEKHPEPTFHIDYLSYSQIDCFRTCPLHYKLRYILRIPTPPSASLSFGTSVHAALKNFYLGIKAGEKPSEKFLLNLLEKHWIREGFTSKEHEKQFFEKGKIYLSGYLKVGYDPKSIPLLVEEPFTVPLENLEKGERPLRIGGRMDRVDRIKDDLIEIVDYKTGAQIPSQREVDSNLQLSFYALAATTLREAQFNKKPEQVKLSLYYFDQQEKLETIRTREQLDAAIRQILDVRKEIESSEFKCNNSILCENCEYSLFCRAD